jgi:hypothetical protein
MASVLFYIPRCANADPNYGSAWFHCRELPYDIPTIVLRNAQKVLQHELLDCFRIYSRAILHYIYQCIQAQYVPELKTSEHVFLEAYRSCFRLAIAEPILVTGNPPVLFAIEGGSLFSSADFITGFISMNRTIFNHRNPPELRRRYLFGTDQVIN